MSQVVHGRSRELYARLLTYVKPFWPVLALGVFANFLYSCIDAGFTYMMKPFLDKSFVEMDLEFVKQIPLIVLLGVTARGLVSAMGGYCMTWVARSVVNVLRQALFSHLLKLPADDYDETTSGQLLSKILYDVEQVAQVSADALTDLVQNICLIIGLLVVMFVISWQLSLMFLVTVPFVGLLVNYTNKRVRRVSHKAQHSMGEVTRIAGEVIDGYRVVRLFGGEKYETKKFGAATESSRINDMKIATSKALNVSGVQFIIAIGIAVIILAAIQLTESVTITVGAFLAVIAAMLQLIKPMKTLTTLNTVIQRGLAGAESVFMLLDKAVEPQGGNELSTAQQGAIRFDKVSFGYRSGASVLQDISFSIAPGKTVAIVGQSGSGKSTIASLIPRFYQITEGTISFDGHDIQDIALSSLREHIALVSQHVTLFNDTVEKNIAYGCPDATPERIREVAHLAYADEFIEQLPDGYETRIGENGLQLSGGQRQRIAIARAILKNAALLIFDEATSALDSTSEQRIQQAIEHITRDKTTLIIAHRLSTIQHADDIIVMHQGRIVEQGTHHNLLSLNGHYASLYRAQEMKEAHGDIFV